MHRLRRVAVALSVVAVLLGAVALGWALHDWSTDSGVDISVKRPLKVVYGDAPAHGTMPNVLGLEEQPARQALADAGVNVTRIRSREQSYVGDRGVVVDQSPAATTPPGDGEVVLFLSVRAAMPSLVGKPAEEAREALERLGATVVTESRYRPGTAEGTVLGSRPPAGAALPRNATLVLAEAPSSVFLSQLQSVSSDCATETLNLDGAEREDALACDIASRSASTAQYVLNRRVDLFKATVGLGDRSPTDAEATFRVVVDGRVARTETVPFGTTKRLVVPVRGALRVRLEASAAAGASGIRGVWADPAFQGGREAIDALTEESSS